MSLLSGFEFLTLGEMFLGVTFHQKTFLFSRIFFVSKQNFEKMALFIETSLKAYSRDAFTTGAIKQELERN